MKKTQVAVFVSGRGSNLQALIDAKTEQSAYEIALVVSDTPNAMALERAENAKIPTLCIEEKTSLQFEQAIAPILTSYSIDVICLAGFFKILSPSFVELWDRRILNIHPSLLPKFKGLHTHERVLQKGERVHGCTVHVATAELDEGPILGQRTVPVLPDDTADTLAARVLVEEHQLYPEVLEYYSKKLQSEEL